MKKMLSPLLAMVAGFGLVLWSMLSSGPLEAFVDMPSIVVTLFGSFAAVLISFPLEDLKKLPKTFKEIVDDSDDDRVEIVHIFNEISRKSRMDGILSVEDDISKIDNEMLAQGIQMVIDGKDGDTIASLLDLELELREESYSIIPKVFNHWGEMAPAFGMVGTLIGLIAMLGELDDPSTIGGGMAVALLTTFYGAVFANLVFIPLASNIQQLASEKMIGYEIVMEGVLAIQEGANPRDLEDKLKSYLNDAELAEFNETAGADVLGT